VVFEYYIWTKKHHFVLRGILTMAGATDFAQKGGSRFLAQPSGPCCLEGFRHTGDPRGSFSTIANVETYISLLSRCLGTIHQRLARDGHLRGCRIYRARLGLFSRGKQKNQCQVLKYTHQIRIRFGSTERIEMTL
jgi:hypothetical protein